MRHRDKVFSQFSEAHTYHNAVQRKRLVMLTVNECALSLTPFVLPTSDTAGSLRWI